MATSVGGAVQYIAQPCSRDTMDNALAKTKQAVSRYKSRSQSDSLNATKSVWAAVRFLRKQLPELERKEKGVTTRVASELSDVLGKLPMFKQLKDEKETTDLSTKPQAEEHILKLENQLKAMVKDLENSKIDEIKGWVENHAVLGALTKTLTRKMPDSTYVFLFRQVKNNNIELVTSRAPDGRVFTRFRPREFFDVKKLYRLYNHRPPVGAAVVVDNKLQDVIGIVPQAKENEDQLHVISSMSKEAASQPAKSFLQSNRVLQSLHELAKDRKVDKGAYILLFVDAEEQIDFDADDEELLASADLTTDDAHSDEETTGEAGGDESSATDEAPAADVSSASEEIAETSADSSGQPATEVADAATGDQAAAEPQTDQPIETGSEPAALESGSDPASAADSSGAAGDETSASQSVSVIDEAPSSESVGQITADFPAVGETFNAVVELSLSASRSSGDSSESANSGESAALQSDAGEIASSADTTGDASSEAVSETDNNGPALSAGEHATPVGDASGDTGQAETTEPDVEQVYTPVEILTRPGSDGGVLTRFYANEFSDVRKVFESFAGKRTISGAAVIRGRELIQVVGNVPQPAEGKSQLDLLILESNHAADKPTRDFMEQNEILNSLHELASGHFSDPNAKVLLFTEDEGRLAVLTPPPSPQREERGRDNKSGRRDGPGGRGRDDRGRNGRGDERSRGGFNREEERPRENAGPSKASPLADFRYPRDIRNGYRNLTRVVGASVIGEQKSTAPVRKDVKRDDNRSGGGGREQRFNDRTPRASKSVVLAAFGRTPLRENVLITEETMRRLGLDFFN